jgi:hypothetical protein
MKSIVVVLITAAVLAGACRREVPYAPMKLGGEVAPPSTPAR